MGTARLRMVAAPRPTRPGGAGWRAWTRGASAGGDGRGAAANGGGPSANSATGGALSAFTVDRPERGFPPSTIVFPAQGSYTLSARTVAALTNLALATGNIGREGAGVN